MDLDEAWIGDERQRSDDSRIESFGVTGREYRTGARRR